ncbi:MAG: DNA repair protein RecO [Thomasclavelia sp.]|nr:DNA repair protein RecO [Thomasclavelia sp.]
MTIKRQEVIDEGIVLKTQDYKDNDSLVTVYTKEYGKITLVARGVKKVKSKNSPACQSLTHSEFTFIPRKGLSVLIKASSINFYRYLKEDIILEAYASYFLEFVYQFAGENEPDEVMFDTLNQALKLVNEGYDYRLVYLLYNAYILKVSGAPLQVDSCVNCNHTDKIVGISLSSGGLVCANCIGEFDQRYDKDFLLAFRHLNKLDLNHIDMLDIKEEYLDELTTIMDYYIDEFTGLRFKTRKFINKLKKL